MQVFPSRVGNPFEKGGKTENATVASPGIVPIYLKDIPNCYNQYKSLIFSHYLFYKHRDNALTAG